MFSPHSFVVEGTTMSETGWIVLGIVVVAIVVALVMGKRLGWFEFLIGGSGFRAGSSQPEKKASAEDAEASGSINVHMEGDGSASADRSKAGQDINVTNIDNPK